MRQKIIKKKYGRIEFTLKSPLATGSGINWYTDHDIIKDSSGKPFIPASAIAGVTREYLKKRMDEEVLRKYYGDIDKNTSETADLEKEPGKKQGQQEQKQTESRIIFYDAVLQEGSPLFLTIRDSVALDEYKTSRKGAKFDMEVLEAGAKFVTYLEQDFYDTGDEDFIQKIAGVFLTGNVSFGGKTMRGYGEITDVKAYEKEFSFLCDPGQEGQPELQLDDWLDFDLYGCGEWDEIKAEAGKRRKEITFALRQRGGISIRKYTTTVREHPDDVVPDYEQLTAHGTDEVEPVIPGTSWAGVFRHRMSELGVRTEGKDSIFGYVQKKETGSDKAGNKGPKDKARSKIRFSESRIHGAKEKILSRNAIDRFTGGTTEGALFTEKTYYGGKTELIIGWQPEEKMGDTEQKALAAAITDLHFGYLAVGGETSIGRGLFVIEKIQWNQKEKEGLPTDFEKAGDVYASVLNIIKEVFGECQ